jgi:hypothetical protein
MRVLVLLGERGERACVNGAVSQQSEAMQRNTQQYNTVQRSKTNTCTGTPVVTSALRKPPTISLD